MTQFSKKGGVCFYTIGSLFPRSLKRTVLDQSTVDNGGASRGRFVAVAVGINASIRIGQEIQCLPYAQFFFLFCSCIIEHKLIRRLCVWPNAGSR